MAFAVGDPVLIKRLKRPGVVKAIPREGHYEVAVGALIFHCEEKDLEKGKPSKHKNEKLTPNPRSSGRPDRGPVSYDSVDLHGLTVEEAMRKVEDALNRAILSEKDQLRIVHGVGTGKIRQAVHAYLTRHGIASHFKVDEGNPGVTLVYF